MSERTGTEAMSLGEPIAEYVPTVANTKGGKIAGLIVSVAGAIAIVYGVIAMFSDTRVFCVPLGGIVLAWFGVRSYRQAIRQSGRRVAVYAEALAHTQDGAATVYPWDCIKEVREAIVTEVDDRTHVSVTTHTYTIVDDAGRQESFDDKIAGIQRLGGTILQEVTRRLLPKAQAAYDGGQTLTFDKFSLSKAGLSNGEETLPWEQVESVALRAGRIEVKEKGEQQLWEIVRASEVPNLHVLLALSQALTKGQDAAT